MSSDALRYRDVIKDPDVEEPVDLWWHRPLAFWLMVRPFRDVAWVTPTRLTLLSMGLGLAGAWCCYLGGSGWPMGYPLGAGLVLGSVVADCADGMLARARGGGSLFGMLLDGMVDLFVGLALWLALAIPTADRLGAWWAWPIMWGALLSIVAHAAIYDGYKNQFLRMVSPPTSHHTVSGPPPWCAPGASWFERFAGTAYERVYGALARSAGASEPASEVDPTRARGIYRDVMRAARWLGLGTHMAVMYVAAALGAWWPLAPFWAALVFFLGLGNLWLLVVMWRWREAGKLLGRIHASGAAKHP